jgi:DNA-binding NarL/FixJ family response regulator
VVEPGSGPGHRCRRNACHHRPAGHAEQSTGRELDILKLVGQGFTNREIGERVHLAESTLKHSMTNNLGKLRVRRRVQAALRATRREKQD